MSAPAAGSVGAAAAPPADPGVALPAAGRRRALLALRLARALTARLPRGWWASALARPVTSSAPGGAEAGLVVLAAEPLPVTGVVEEPLLVAELAPGGRGPGHWRDRGVPTAWWLTAEGAVIADARGERRLPAPVALPLPPLPAAPAGLALPWPLPAEPIVLPEASWA